jgi:hypothetical protein
MHFLLFALSAFIPHAHAFDVNQIGSGPGIGQMWGTITALFPYKSGGLVPNQIMGRVQTILVAIIGSAATVGLGYAALSLVSGGINEEGISKAKTIAKNVIFGLILAILADGIVNYVIQKLWEVKGG